MRRSSRVILLVGIFLAVGAFILILFLNAGGRSAATPTPAVAHIVVAAVDIPQGTSITESMLTTRDVPLEEAPGDSFALTASVIGKTARQSVAAGAYLPESAITGAPGTIDVAAELKPGERAMSLSVDEVTGVGTLIQPGDRVDAIISFVGNPSNPVEVPEIVLVPPTVAQRLGCAGRLVCDTGIVVNGQTVKMVLQNLRVVFTLLPPPAATTGGAASPAPVQPALTGRTEIVIVAVSAQQAEVLRFAQLHIAPITLVLRATTDGEAPPDETTGIILRTMIDTYGVLPPEPIFIPLPPELAQ